MLLFFVFLCFFFYFFFFFFNDTATTEIYTLSLHDALPISPRLLPHLGQDPLQPRLGGIVDVRHRGRDGRVLLRDQRVHPLRDGAVRGVTLAAGAQLDQVHRLAGVEVEHVADPVAQAERVRRRGGEPRAGEPPVLGGRALQRRTVGVA